MSFSKPDLPKPEPIPSTPRKSDAEVSAEQLAKRRQLAARKGASSTLLTGGQGVTAPENTASKTLLGQ